MPFSAKSFNVLDYIPGKDSSEKMKNGLLVLALAYSTGEVAWRRINKLRKEKQKANDASDELLNYVLNYILNDLGIVTTDQIEKYVVEIIETKYPHLDKQKIDELVKTINGRLSDLESKVNKSENKIAEENVSQNKSQKFQNWPKRSENLGEEDESVQENDQNDRQERKEAHNKVETDGISA